MLKKVLLGIGVVALAGAVVLGATAAEVSTVATLAIGFAGAIVAVIGIFKKEA